MFLFFFYLFHFLVFLPYQEFRESDPDFILLFAWNHAKEIMEKEKDYVNGNKKWIMYVPEAKILND